MSVNVTLVSVEASPTAVVAATTTWAEFPSLWKPMLDKVWTFLANAPAGLYKDGHNVMLYKDDLRSVEIGVQVNRPFKGSGEILSSCLPGGLVATARHAGPIDRLGDTRSAACARCAPTADRVRRQRWEL